VATIDNYFSFRPPDLFVTAIKHLPFKLYRISFIHENLSTKL